MAFVSGLSVKDGQTFQIFLTVEQITASSCVVVASADREALVERVHVSLLAVKSTSSHIQQFGEMRQRANNGWLGGNENKLYSYALPDKIKTVLEPIFIQGFTGFNAEN